VHGLVDPAPPQRRVWPPSSAGEPIRGSWWGHPAGHAIFDALNSLTESPDVVRTRLVNGKVTLVHRRLWPALARLADSFRVSPPKASSLPAHAQNAIMSVWAVVGPRHSGQQRSTTVPSGQPNLQLVSRNRP